MPTTKTATKPRLTPRQRVMSLLTEYGAELRTDDDQPGLHGEVTAPTGMVFANGMHTILLGYPGKRLDAWPILLKALKDGIRPCQNEACEVCPQPEPTPIRTTRNVPLSTATPGSYEIVVDDLPEVATPTGEVTTFSDPMQPEEDRPSGLVFAGASVTDAILAKLVEAMGSRQVAGWKRTSRPMAPYGLAAEYRAAYHRGWAAAGNRSFVLVDDASERYGKGFTDGYGDRVNGREAWASAI